MGLQKFWRYTCLAVNRGAVKRGFTLYSIEKIWQKVNGPNQFSLPVGHRTTDNVDDCNTSTCLMGEIIFLFSSTF